MAAYEAALTGPRTAIGAGRIKPGSVAAVVAEYFDSQAFFTSKSAGTQRMRRGILERFRAAYGDRPFASLPAEWIEALLDSKPPHAARSWLVTLRSLCAFGLKRKWLRADPTANIKLRTVKGDGFHTWNEEEIAGFEAYYAIGTKPRLAHSGAAMWCAWGGSTSARHQMVQPCTSSSARPVLSLSLLKNQFGAIEGRDK
jgi:hypothetical protein